MSGEPDVRDVVANGGVGRRFRDLERDLVFIVMVPTATAAKRMNVAEDNNSSMIQDSSLGLCCFQDHLFTKIPLKFFGYHYFDT